MKKKNILVFGFVLVALTTLFGVALCADQFVLPKQTNKDKKLSKNELKESIGQEIRDAFDISTNINKQSGLCQVAMCKVDSLSYQNIVPLQKNLGELHIELAEIQKKFSCLIERLVNNQKPFKKTSRDNLDKSFCVLRDVKHGLKGCEVQLTSLNKRFTKDAEFGSFKKMTEHAVDELKKSVTCLNACEGLKVS